MPLNSLIRTAGEVLGGSKADHQQNDAVDLAIDALSDSLGHSHPRLRGHHFE